MKEILDVKRADPQVFQVLLIDNNAAQEVEVEENDEIDYTRIHEHLKHGGSVFITSKPSQKITPPRPKKKALRKKSGLVKVTAFYFDHV